MLYNNIYARKGRIMSQEELVQNSIVRLTIFLKISQLRREQLSTLTYTHIVNVLFFLIWKQKMPATINQAVNDIMKLEAKDVVSALHTLAMIEGYSMSLDNIDSFLGGK